MFTATMLWSPPCVILLQDLLHIYFSALLRGSPCSPKCHTIAIIIELCTYIHNKLSQLYQYIESCRLCVVKSDVSKLLSFVTWLQWYCIVVFWHVETTSNFLQLSLSNELSVNKELKFEFCDQFWNFSYRVISLSLLISSKLAWTPSQGSYPLALLFVFL